MANAALTENEQLVLTLIGALRAPAGISRELGLTIADMLDPAGSAPFQLKLTSRQYRGRPRGSWTDHSGAALRVLKLIAEQVPRKRALYQVSQEYKISESTIQTAMQRLSIMSSEDEAFKSMIQAIVSQGSAAK